MIDRSRRHHITIARVGRLRASLLVFRLHHREAVALELKHRALGLDAVKPRIVAAEDRALDRPVGGAERGVAELLLHVFRYLKTAQAFDLPLRRAGPQRVGAPADTVGAETLDQR